MQKAGFISVIGRTNAGKSSLINALLGEKLALVSHKQNATRRKINAIVMHENNQLIFIDTPGLHTSQKLFNQKLVEIALKSIEGVDLILFVVSAKDSTKDYEGFLSLNSKAPHILILNKVDLLSNEALLAKMNEYSKFSSHFKALIPFSNKHKSYKKALLDEASKYLPQHPYYYDEDLLSNSNEKELYRDFILQALFENFSDELPYCCEVAIDCVRDTKNLVYIEALIITDTPSHKSMLIGKDGQSIKRLGLNARKILEAFIQRKVMLKLLVQVKKSWQKDEDFLKKVVFHEN